MNFKKINFGENSLFEGNFEIKNFPENVEFYFPKIRKFKNPFVFESKTFSEIYGRMSLISFDPLLKISGKNENFEIEILNSRGEKFFEKLQKSDFKNVENFKKNSQKISGEIRNLKNEKSQNLFSKKSTIADALRIFLEKFKTRTKNLFGIYGAFSYDFVRLFEDLPTKNSQTETPDFCFFLYDSFLKFDHLKNTARCVLFRENENFLEKDFAEISQNFSQKNSEISNFKITNSAFDFSKNEFINLIEKAREFARKGDLFEVVF